MISVTDIPWWFRGVIRRLGQTSTIAVVVLLLILSVLVGAAVVMIVEMAGGSNGPKTYWDALWWFVVTITGVGLDAVAPVTPVGRASSATVLMLARIFFGMFTAAIASALINRLLMEGKGMGQVALRNHVVICGWTSRGFEIVKQLTRDERSQDIVILAGLEESPVRRSGVHFVRGDPTMEKDLRRADVCRAETVIILSDESTPGLSDSTTDARSVLVALAVETLNKGVYTFAEVRQTANCQHFERANVNEVLVTNDLVSALMARSSVHHGLTAVLTDLLTSDAGNEIYVLPTPPSLVGKPFDDLLIQLQTTKRAILLGIRRGEEIVLNPKDPLIVTRGDSLILVARENLVLE
jgi:voltage-gated potassium channel